MARIKLSVFLDEAINKQVAKLNENEPSHAAEQAKQLGLISKGWGRYADPSTGEIVAISKGGHLIKTADGTDPHTSDQFTKLKMTTSTGDGNRGLGSTETTSSNVLDHPTYKNSPDTTPPEFDTGHPVVPVNNMAMKSRLYPGYKPPAPTTKVPTQADLQAKAQAASLNHLNKTQDRPNDYNTADHDEDPFKDKTPYVHHPHDDSYDYPTNHPARRRFGA